MIDIRDSSEDEMVYAFLNMEYSSERFHDEIAQGLAKLGLDESLICDESQTCESSAVHGNLACESPTACGNLTCESPTVRGNLTCESPTVRGNLTCESPTVRGNLTCESPTVRGNLTCESPTACGNLTCDDSDRDGRHVPVWKTENPEFSDTEKNERRRDLLREFRGYPDREIFENYPSDIRWKLVRMEKGDLDKLRYVDYCYWNDLSRDTSKPSEGALSVLKGITSCDVPNDGFWRGLNALAAGTGFPPLILLTSDEQKYLILEGHLRATVYGMKPGSEAGTLAYVGVCTEGALRKKNKGF